ncbi:hypothetical protein TTHERM_001050619 (macronuclear) [Tetrahymena thermophila SB210]|uniref:Uncharacterized protein n=1 Tax=Tetrahymena thermophila (strain SB210) TaxID=312017 RepID=W7XL89_TETTS|nr:hypothetical protein TTHERM_001050619 [Tetrahymena thermophila SB210]EWS75869.1 hypothetical protein TTHERM_001050619 [Tetrahymena thermophila SB210]|eukprot:XP_012651604.1 hypothetical protein TTHERM_001050619 [Tetrahymena thermophila SB210]
MATNQQQNQKAILLSKLIYLKKQEEKVKVLHLQSYSQPLWLDVKMLQLRQLRKTQALLFFNHHLTSKEKETIGDLAILLYKKIVLLLPGYQEFGGQFILIQMEQMNKQINQIISQKRDVLLLEWLQIQGVNQKYNGKSQIDHLFLNNIFIKLLVSIQKIQNYVFLFFI